MITLQARLVAASIVMLCAACGVTVAAALYRGASPSNASAGAQDVSNLERRLGNLEQRLYSIESSINRLNQQAVISQRPVSPSAGARDTGVDLLRSEVEMLRRRLGEVECGLVKLDERTTARRVAADSRNRTEASNTDPCRLNAETPLRLTTRP